MVSLFLFPLLSASSICISDKITNTISFTSLGGNLVSIIASNMRFIAAKKFVLKPQSAFCISSTQVVKLWAFSRLIHFGTELNVITRFPKEDISAIRTPIAIAAYNGSPSIDPDVSTIAIIFPNFLF